jgi:hypothetical protein
MLDAMTQYEPISLGMGDDQSGPFVNFTVDEPWPENALIQEYDAHVQIEDGKEIISFVCDNGSARFEVVGRDKFGAYECRLLPGSTYEPRKA